MKTLLIIFAASVAVSADVPLGQSFKGKFGSFVDGALEFCNVDIDSTTTKAVWLPPQWFSKDLCHYCLMVSYGGTSGIYPITDNCIICESDLVLLSVFAFQDFGDPDVVNLFFGANFTFVNCLTTAAAEDVTVSVATTFSKASTTSLTIDETTVSSKIDISTEAFTTTSTLEDKTTSSYMNPISTSSSFDIETTSKSATLNLSSTKHSTLFYLNTTRSAFVSSSKIIDSTTTTNKIILSTTMAYNFSSPKYHRNNLICLLLISVAYIFTTLF